MSNNRRLPDLAFDGTPGDSALLIDGVRLKVQGEEDTESEYDFLRRIFNHLCAMRDDLQTYRKWELAMFEHLANFPRLPITRGDK